MLTKKDVCYIAGPMTGRPLFNYPAFYGIAGIIEKEYDCTVLNPARQPNGLAYEEYMRLAMEDLDCATVIVLLDGWNYSCGAKREFVKARQRNIRILFQEQIELVLAERIKLANKIAAKEAK